MKYLGLSLIGHGVLVFVLIFLLLPKPVQNSIHIAAQKTVWITMVKQAHLQPHPKPKKIAHKGLIKIKKLPKLHPVKKAVKKDKVHKTIHMKGHHAIKGKQLNQLISLLYQQINNHYHPSEQASFMQEQGTTVVAFVLLPSGHAMQIHVKKTSGFKLLDQAAIQAVQVASPFYFKAIKLQQKQGFQIPIEYQNN